LLCVFFVCACVCMCWLRLLLPRGNEVALGEGRRSICSNPSSCQSVSLLAARRWWLPRVSALDECPLERRVTVGKTEHRRIVGRRAPNCSPLRNDLTCPIWNIDSNGWSRHESECFCVTVKWTTWNLFPEWFSTEQSCQGHQQQMSPFYKVVRRALGKRGHKTSVFRKCVLRCCFLIVL